MVVVAGDLQGADSDGVLDRLPYEKKLLVRDCSLVDRSRPSLVGMSDSSRHVVVVDLVGVQDGVPGPN
jgi:hypothetical protein